MNQQMMAVLSAYPAPKASDEFLWLQLNQAWLSEELAQCHNVPKRLDDDLLGTQSLMPLNIEKILSITRFSWTTR